MTLSATFRRVRAEAASELHRRAQSPLFHFPLTEAACCIGCEAVFRLSERNCPACGSGNVMSIAKWVTG
jgi:predicted amidophosphoribosyltransferase